MHDAKHLPSFNSARWKAGYIPDIAFVNQTIGSLCKKGVLDPIPRTQHRPISVSVHAAVTPTIVPYQRRFNFQKADWISFTTGLENQIYNISCSWQFISLLFSQHKKLNERIKTTSEKRMQVTKQIDVKHTQIF